MHKTHTQTDPSRRASDLKKQQADPGSQPKEPTGSLTSALAVASAAARAVLAPDTESSGGGPARVAGRPSGSEAAAWASLGLLFRLTGPPVGWGWEGSEDGGVVEEGTGGRADGWGIVRTATGILVPPPPPPPPPATERWIWEWASTLADMALRGFGDWRLPQLSQGKGMLEEGWVYMAIVPHWLLFVVRMRVHSFHVKVAGLTA